MQDAIAQNRAIRPAAPSMARSLPFVRGRRVLLLQGPVGGFFARLGAALEANGNHVRKVNFNAGDWFYYRHGLAYRGRMADWPAWLAALIAREEIDLILMFSDCRPIHVAARDVAARAGIETGVFEEGYIRPDHITLEREGVNAHSCTDFSTFAGEDARTDQPPSRAMGNTFPGKARASLWYFLAGILGRPLFPFYRHHKALSVLQAFWWTRAGMRKHLSHKRDQAAMARISGPLRGKFYLVPLQVYDDYQIIAHSDYADVGDFIAAVIRSFAVHAAPDMSLVFKHHPMDRGYRHYGGLIRRVAGEAGVADRVLYHHDLHLPTALAAARGVVVVNSTVGLDSLWLGRPTRVMGRAFYDLPGLTFQGPLDAFWDAADTAIPDRKMFLALRRNILEKTQMNGSFYQPAPPDPAHPAAEPGFAGLAEPDPAHG